MVRGLAAGTDDPGPAATGLHVEGATLTAVRRRHGWLELRVVRLQPDAGTVRVRLPLDPTQRLEARAADLLGRAGDPIAVHGDEVALALGGWEIRTLQLRTVGGP